MREKVSVCLIVKDEETNLRACLTPLVGLFSEIIVVDTGSRDRTREVAAEFGARVVDLPWRDDFSAARNEALRHATGDWIVWLDADDRIDEINRQRLGELIASLTDDPVAYVCEIASTPEYEADGVSLISQVRLFRRHRDARWSGRVHEQLLPCLQSLNYKIVCTNIRICHEGYKDPVLRRRKIDRDLRLLRMEYAVSPYDPAVLCNLGMSYLRLHRDAEAQMYFTRCLQHAPLDASDWLRAVYRALAVSLRYSCRIEQALTILARGLERFPDDSEMLYVQAEMLVELAEFARAEQTLLKILKLQPHAYFVFCGLERCARTESLRLLACVYVEQKRFHEAEQVFQRLLAEHPDYATGWLSLARYYLECRRFQDLEHAIRQLGKCPSGDILSMVMTAAYLIEREDLDAAQRLVQAAIVRAPQFVWAHVVLGRILELRGTDREQLVAVLNRILALDPGNVATRQVLANSNNVDTSSLVSSNSRSNHNQGTLSWTIMVNA